MSADPATVGERVLANLEAGRQRAIAQRRQRSAQLQAAVRAELDLDILRGHGDHGRPGRIARQLRRAGVKVTERGARKILHRLTSGSGQP